MNDKQVLRIGKISSVNYEKGTARVTYEDRDGSTTVELPFLAWEYWMPQIEDRVVTGHLSNGTTSAVIIGPLWHDEHRPIEGKDGIYRKEFESIQGVAYLRYDASEKSLKIVAGGVTIAIQGGSVCISGTLTVNGILTVSEALTVNDALNVTGKLTVGGAIEAAGNVKAGAGATVTGNVSATGNISATGDISSGGTIVATGDVTAGSISGKSHTHTAPDGGGETSGPR